TSTLTNFLISPQFYAVFNTSVTVNWVAFSTGPGTNTSEGYTVQASSTNFNGTGTIYSSSTFDAAQSTLTVIGLDPNIAYNFRAGGINWNSVVNYTALGSRTTAA